MNFFSFSSFFVRVWGLGKPAPLTKPPQSSQQRLTASLGACVLACALSACGSVGIGIGVPLGPLSVGVGLGSGGLSAGVGTGIGPVGVGVGVNQRGQVTGQTGIGASMSVGGGARVGASVGAGTVLYDPATTRTNTGTNITAPVPLGSPPGTGVQWYGPNGPVPACQVQGGCP